jgi:hypothetical protein
MKVTFRCKQSGNTVSFTDETDIASMRKEEGYIEVAVNDLAADEVVAEKPAKEPVKMEPVKMEYTKSEAKRQKAADAPVVANVPAKPLEYKMVI